MFGAKDQFPHTCCPWCYIGVHLWYLVSLKFWRDTEILFLLVCNILWGFFFHILICQTWIKMEQIIFRAKIRFLSYFTQQLSNSIDIRWNFSFFFIDVSLYSTIAVQRDLKGHFNTLFPPSLFYIRLQTHPHKCPYL